MTDGKWQTDDQTPFHGVFFYRCLFHTRVLISVLSPRDARHDVLDRVQIPGRRAAPHASAEGRDINLIGGGRINDHAVPPFEVVAFDPRPGRAAVNRTIRGRIETADVQLTRIARVDRQVVNVLRLVEDVAPAL